MLIKTADDKQRRLKLLEELQAPSFSLLNRSRASQLSEQQRRALSTASPHEAACR